MTAYLSILKKECEFCNSVALDSLWNIKEYSVRLCKSCGLIFVNGINEDSSNFYTREYFIPYIKKEKEKLICSQRLFQYITPLINKGKILDIGCGTGCFLKIAKDLGWQVYGLDTSEEICEYARTKFNIPHIYSSDLKNINFEKDEFDLIALLDVLGHLKRPWEYLKKINHILKDKGILFLKFPIRKKFAFKLAKFFNYFLKNSYSLVHLPYQIYHFNPTSITNLLKATGFEVYRIYYIRDQGLSDIDSIKSFISYLLANIFDFAANYASPKNSLIVLARKQ